MNTPLAAKMGMKIYEIDYLVVRSVDENPCGPRCTRVFAWHVDHAKTMVGTKYDRRYDCGAFVFQSIKLASRQWEIA